jgi:hypothetical protein
MATLNVTRSYADGDVLFEADIDAFLDDIESFLNTTKVSDDNIQDAGITGSTKLIDGSVTAGKLASDAVTTVKILDANVTAAKLGTGAVTTVKILDANVTAAKLAANAVETAAIAASAVTTSKIQDAAVTLAKLAARTVGSSAASGEFAKNGTVIAYSAGASSSYTDVTNATLSITTTGRPVYFAFYPSSTAGGATADGTANTTTTGQSTISCFVKVVRSGSDVAVYSATNTAQTTNGNTYSALVAPFSVYDFPAAGTYTYKLQIKATSSGFIAGSAMSANGWIVAYEL